MAQGLSKRVLTVHVAEGEDLQKVIHAAGFKHIEQDEYLDADGNHCLGTNEEGPYEIYECDGVDCSFWQHASDLADVE